MAKTADKFALTNAIYALDSAYQRFFRRQGGYPRFKSRHHSRMSHTTNYTNGNIAVLAGEIKLPKLGKVGAVVQQKGTGRLAPAGHGTQGKVTAVIMCQSLSEYEVG